MEKQRTIRTTVSLSGIGLHTGNRVSILLKPAVVDSGICFIRTDSPEKLKVSATIASIFSLENVSRRTSIGKEPYEIQTVEHLLCALFGLGIDNLEIEIDGNEVPGMDGSSLNFFEALEKAGIQEQEKEKIVYAVKEPIFLSEGGSSLAIFPYDGFKVSYTMDYNHPYLGTQFFELEVTQGSFKSELAAARTFCLEEEAALLQSQGLGKGANFENTLVVGKAGVVKNKLRFPNEFIRHKISDLLGDLSLLGYPIKAHIVAIKSGHSLNLKLASKIAEQRVEKGFGFVDLKEGASLSVEEIMKIIPHREPFLFVDRITHLEVGKRATGYKNVTINDYFFKGHFPGKPVMPGVLMVEAMAQVGGVMMLAAPVNRGKLAFFMTADKIKFRKNVVPGDQLVFEVVAGRIKARTGQVFAKALVDGKVVCEAEFMFAMADY